MIPDSDRLSWEEWAALIVLASAIVFTLCVGVFVAGSWVVERAMELFRQL